MGHTRISLLHRLLLFTEVYRDTIIRAACLGVFALVAVGYVARMEANPVVATERVTGVVESIRVPINPNGSAGRALYYSYDVRLDDDKALIFIDDDVGTPHPVGSVLPLERQHHKSGADTYRLLDG
ncbi:hypothetical protein DPM33_06650 [Mesorhizobium hawassense]|uniref:Uncharacterized protein n=2 Tax=Mesorhizobium hawassense TaxID=1209954 RepID=A0A330HU95_9HYPH|nr:hypothetical protein DPM33_06650 [Mesorhizobium hawassense]